MIANIVTPMPIFMPIHSTSSGSGDPLILISVTVGFFVLGLLLFLGGYFYDGIKNKEWSLLNDDNMAKMCGAIIMVVVTALAFIVGIAFLVHSWLK